MAGDNTIDDTKPADSAGEAVDPEDQETVMYGQRGLFHDLEVRLAAEQAGARKSKRDAERQVWDEGAGDELVEDAEEADQGSDTVEMSAAETEAIQREAKLRVNPLEPKGRGGGASATTGGSQNDARRVAERRPHEDRRRRMAGGRRNAADALICTCRMCGRRVRWPKARRFRGPRRANHGFRCDTCGNVFCAEHVVRVSTVMESLLYHGRFRCLLCELGRKSAAPTRSGPSRR